MDLQYKKNITRQLNRFNEQRDKLINEHKGRENEFTYWGGYSLGYLDGKISQIENTIDKINESESLTNSNSIENPLNIFFDSMIKDLNNMQIECGKLKISNYEFNDISNIIGNLKDYIINCVSYGK